MAGDKDRVGAKDAGRRVAQKALHLVIALAAMIPVLTLVGTVAPSAGAAVSTSVTVTRDSDGVPHIKAANFTALGYGEAWAFSQDNFCTLAQDFVTVNGERSRFFGPRGTSLNYSAGAEDSNLDSDLFWQSIRSSGVVTRLIHEAPPNGPLPQVLQVYRGFVAGYNAYLHSGKLNDPRCAGKRWVRPITLTDMFLRGQQIVTEAASAQFITDEVNAVPPTASTTSSASADSPDVASLVADLGGNGEVTAGSNGIGIGSQDTADGDGMVLANPHFPWRGTERFWMAQLTVPGRYNVEGGTLEGFPLIGIGFNQDLAWTHTVSTDFRFTFYQLSLVPGDPTSYYVDGKPYKMGKETVRVDVSHRTTSHTFYTTRWGRVLVVPQAGYRWTTTTAYAVDDSTLNDLGRAANEYLRMGQATSVTDLLKVESTYLAIPTFNTIAADNTGHALYADVGDTPDVPQSLINACTPAGAAQVVYAAARVITLDGSRSACAWQNDSGTPVPGIFNASHLPHTIRTDYVENSNDSYWLANPSAPFPAYSPIIGDIDTTQGLRTRLGNQMIAQRIAGSDGLGPPEFTLASLQAMWESDQSALAQLVLKPLVSACQATPTVKASNGTLVDLTAACRALAGYNGTGALNATGGWLFSEWYALAPSDNFWATPFNVSAPLTTPSGLDTSNPAILRALADAVLSLRAHHIALDASYGQVQHATRNGVKIPIPGCDTGCFNAIYAADGRGGALDADPYGEVHDGSSLVMTTELTAHGPTSQGILTYSQATNPKSPWFANMTKLYSERRWVSLPYTAAQLAHDRGARTTTLSAP
jgi:acyl-homoserine-lactone acylase